MTSILGENINIVRPKLIKTSIIRRYDRPEITYNKRSKKNKENSGKVKNICMLLKDNKIVSLPQGTHIDVMQSFNLSFEDVAATGWELENGNFVWR
ncbi:MAG: hypothetical protein KJ888_20440 [Gammaproteobacteria bacterium]|uniref:Uncharacterized protein n=1 Tax=viral metagenome TaxID=1070528 RepID=A0A6M3K4M8_9ZZZZ|nr:hypothetical protein [Gammaproteobacteria bacterium]